MRGPVTVSAWKASQTVPNAGNFRVRTSIEDETWNEVSDGSVFETVAPGRIRVWVDSFDGWADDDPRNIWVDVDYGERYDFQHTDNGDLPVPNVLRRLAGTQAGYYPGVVSGHVMRGTDMLGNRVLTATFDPGNGAPVGTIDQTVTVTVTDGLVTETLTFIVRLIHPQPYYSDRLKTTYAPNSAEPTRTGFVYVSRDGDFTDAPEARPETATVSAIAHITIPDGRFSPGDMRDWASARWFHTDAACVMFKAGETYYPQAQVSPGHVGINGQITTWYHSGANGTEDFVFDGADFNSFNPAADGALIGATGAVFSGVRLHNFKLKISDYDVSDVTWREWWNIIKYTGKIGTLTENSSDSVATGFNGETISNGNGVYTQIVSDDGAGTLICRQVVDTSDVDDAAAAQAFFTDGDILTGQAGGATMTFVAAGSRQDRTQKTPSDGIGCNEIRGLLVDNLRIIGAKSGISGLGLGALVSDTLIDRYWNYGAQQTGGDAASWSECGNVTVQPSQYEGTPRNFGGASVSGNRNYFNAMIEGTDLATNDVSHASRRYAQIFEVSHHFCFANTYGGHGAAHQPLQRLGTGGSAAEGDLTYQMYGCGYRGGGNQVHFATIGDNQVPRTPAVIRVERSHLQASHATPQSNVTSTYTNFVVRNCIVDRPAGNGWAATNIEWFASGTANYVADPDVNPVSPIFEFNTFTAYLNTSPATNVTGPYDAIRAVPVIFRNNAYILNQSVLGSIDADILALSDDLTDYDSDLRPLATALAYQAATAPIVPAASTDALSAVRGINASLGALEPTI